MIDIATLTGLTAGHLLALSPDELTAADDAAEKISAWLDAADAADRARALGAEGRWVLARLVHEETEAMVTAVVPGGLPALRGAPSPPCSMEFSAVVIKLLTLVRTIMREAHDHHQFDHIASMFYRS
jgi:hypothetical protein